MRLLIITLLILSPFMTMLAQSSARPTSPSGPSAEELNKSGIDYGDARDYEKAGQSFAESVQLYDRQAALAWYRKGMIELDANRHDAALACFIEAAHRDPAHAQSAERAGYLYYKKGAYTEAVAMGERVLLVDPENVEVKSWLPDAHKQRIAATKDMREKTAEQKTGSTGSVAMFKQRSIYDSTFFLEFSGIIRSGYDSDDKGDYRYIDSPGNITNFPYTLNTSYRINKKWGALAAFENPNTGGAMPHVCTQQERFEALYHSGKFVFGGGITVFHHKSDAVFEKRVAIIDIKGGMSLLHRGRDTELEMLFYPKFLIPDGSWTTGESMDASLFTMKYTYIHRSDFRFYTRVDSRDYYFYDNRATSAQYYGSFILAAGTHYDLHRFLGLGDLRFTGELGKKINLEKSLDKNIYGIANGQGFPGLDLGGKGLFSGYHSTSTLISAGVREQFNPNFFFAQDVIAEIAGYKAPRSEFSLRLTGGYSL